MIPIEFRSMGDWPGELRATRADSPFSSTWSATRAVLDLELRQLNAADVVIELAVPPSAIRVDGGLRADARLPDHPGVILSFDSTHGPLRYATDVYQKAQWRRNALEGWQANLRAIALGLEALRKVDRYGIAGRGEQYTGWSALGPGVIAAPAAAMTADEAAHFIADATGDPFLGAFEVLQTWADGRDLVYRQAAKRLHPDTGGDPEAFKRLQTARDTLDRLVG